MNPWCNGEGRDRSERLLLLKNAPIEVEFEGWRSTTQYLVRHGWKIYHHFRQDTMTEQILIQNRYCVGISDVVTFSQYRDVLIPRPGSLTPPLRGHHEPFHIHIQLAGNITLSHMHTRYAGTRFRPIDPVARVVETYGVDVRSLALFDDAPERSIVVPEPTYDELMDQLLEKQRPIQADIRAKHGRSLIHKPNSGVIIRVAA